MRLPSVRATEVGTRSVETSRGQRMACVLVVEHDVILRYSLATGLRLGGHEVLEASTADEAQTTLSSFLTIDLVVTDVPMCECRAQLTVWN
jgi:CheY-like chemotaxis protein